MGMYDDIQADLKEAALGDLADAVAILTVTVDTLGAYDPTIDSYTKTTLTSTMDCFVTETKTNDNVDESDNEGDATVIVLDSNKTVEFKIGLKVIVRNVNYQISEIVVDGAGATHTLTLRKIR